MSVDKSTATLQDRTSAGHNWPGAYPQYCGTRRRTACVLRPPQGIAWSVGIACFGRAESAASAGRWMGPGRMVDSRFLFRLARDHPRDPPGSWPMISLSYAASAYPSGLLAVTPRWPTLPSILVAPLPKHPSFSHCFTKRCTQLRSLSTSEISVSAFLSKRFGTGMMFSSGRTGHLERAQSRGDHIH